MDDQVFSLFVLVACLSTLAMPAIAQPAFAVLAAALVVLAHLAANEGPATPAVQDRPTIMDG